MSKPIRGKRICLVDPVVVASRTPDREPMPELPAGALLPADFPRAGYRAEQLIELEEWYLLTSQTAMQRLFFLLRTTRDGGEPTYKSALHCVAILVKLLGFNPGMSWAAIARQLGTSAPSFCLLRRRVWQRLRESTHPSSRFERLQAAARLRQLARKLEISAATKK